MKSAFCQSPPFFWQIGCGVLLLLLSPTAVRANPTFQDDVLPVFKKHCLSCHNPDKKKAGLDLTSVAAIREGSSGGEVAKPGVPDTSVLFMVMDHHEDYEAMPPKKPKLAQDQIQIVHKWLAGGMVDAAGGKSMLREISFSVKEGSAHRPETPALPANLPEIPILTGNRPPPILALAASPWAHLVATSGHEQIYLFGKSKSAATASDFEPYAKEDLIFHEDFENTPDNLQTIEGKIGQAVRIEEKGWMLQPDQLPHDFPQTTEAFTISLWLKPDQEMQSPMVFGRGSFYLFLEKRKNGWNVRMQTRDSKNTISYYGRIGEIAAGAWQLVTVTFDGKDWTFYYNGSEIVKQPKPTERVGFLEWDRPFWIGWDGEHQDRLYRGGVDDLRIYRKALQKDEILQIFQNAQPRFQHLGTLPFPEGTVHELRFSRNGELLVAAGGVGAYSGRAVIFDVQTGKRIAEIGDEQDIILSADISSDHRYLAIGTPAKKAKIYLIEKGQLLHEISKHTDWVTAVRFRPEGDWLATGDRNGGIHIWETESGGIVYTLDEHKVKVSALDWRSDGKMLASGGEDGKIVLWDMKDGWPTRTAKAHDVAGGDRYTRSSGVLDLVYSRTGTLLTSGRDRALRWWNPDGTKQGELLDTEGLPTQVSYGPDGELGFVGDIGGTLSIYDLGTGGLAQKLPAPGTSKRSD